MRGPGQGRQGKGWGGHHPWLPFEWGWEQELGSSSITSFFRKIKTLGEDDPWLDDTAAWIERSRQLQKEKDLAEKRVSTWAAWGGCPVLLVA